MYFIGMATEMDGFRMWWQNGICRWMWKKEKMFAWKEISSVIWVSKRTRKQKTHQRKLFSAFFPFFAARNAIVWKRSFLHKINTKFLYEMDFPFALCHDIDIFFACSTFFYLDLCAMLCAVAHPLIPKTIKNFTVHIHFTLFAITILKAFLRSFQLQTDHWCV